MKYFYSLSENKFFEIDESDKKSEKLIAALPKDANELTPEEFVKFTAALASGLVMKLVSKKLQAIDPTPAPEPVKYFYSKTTSGFYVSNIHESMPDDAVEITNDERLTLLDNQSKGKIIVADTEGKPITTDAPEFSNSNWTGDAWEVDLEKAKEQKSDAINAKRDLLQTSGFLFKNKKIDSDQKSRTLISTETLAALSALVTKSSYEVSWTCADGSVLALDATGVIEMNQALAEFGNELHAQAVSLKLQIAKSKNADALSKINWE